MDNFYTLKGDTVVLRCKIVPNSSKNEVCGVLDDALKIKIKAPAVENKANEELVKYIAKLLSLPKSSVYIKTGNTSKVKSVCLENCSIDKINILCDIIK